MTLQKTSCMVGVLVVSGVLATVAVARTWTAASGSFTVEAELVGIDDPPGTVTLQRTDGKELTIPRDTLSEVDQEYLEQQGGRLAGKTEDGPSRNGQAMEKESIRVEFTVREGSRYGRLVEGAEVQLVYSSADGMTEELMDDGKTDSSGRVELDVHLGDSGKGKYAVDITHVGQTRRTTLDRFPVARGVTLYATVRPPEKLMRVTVECEEGRELFAVMPIFSLGVDVVNGGGKSAPGAELAGQRITFECLPDAVVGVIFKKQAEADGADDKKSKETTLFLPLRPGDDRKTLRFRVGESCVYMNGALVWVDFTDMDDPAAWILNNTTKRSDNIVVALVNALVASVKTSTLRSVSIGTTNEYLPVLRCLKGSGVGIVVEDLDSSDMSKDFVRALSEVNSSEVLIRCREFAALDGALPAAESLLLAVDAGETIPNLSGLKKLRHLLLVGEDDDSELNLEPIENLTQLRSLVILGKCRNVDVLGSLSGLQFLTVANNDSSVLIPSVLNRLPRLQYVAAAFPGHTDFSFVQRMPFLQTLAIVNISEQHDLRPLAKSPRLRCLALWCPGTDFDDITDLGDVSEFRRARPDVDVVPYGWGVCLGSFWLVLLAATAAIAAWLIRRRRNSIRTVRRMTAS